MRGIFRILGVPEMLPTLARVASSALSRLFGQATRKRPHVANVGRLMATSVGLVVCGSRVPIQPGD
ncbi:MAG TPA: hypothetical protein PKD64_19080 [Pirellulaceae bacterium]|nr:hypothetical protein [Pirellulaceae bacterium]